MNRRGAGALVGDVPAIMSQDGNLPDVLRQMLAVLHAERQALAALDLEGMIGTAADKRALCGRMEDVTQLDAECHGLAETARRLNEANRQVRNLLAANVGARLEALTGLRPLYAPHTHSHAAVSRF